MLLHTTLHPNGSFMLCESISEFMPDPAPTPVKPEVVSKVTAAIDEKCYDPVMALTLKVAPLYERVYELMRRPFDHNDKEGVVRLLQDISDTATEVADKMRLCLSKQRVISMVCCDEWIYEPIQHMMRTLMNNLTYLRQQGYTSIDYDYSMMKDLEPYNLEGILNVYMTLNKDMLPDRPMSFLDISKLADQFGSSFIDSFADPMDMMKCFTEDPARLSRLELKCHETITLDEVMKYARWNRHNIAVPECEATAMCPTLICYVSSMLRRVKQCTYQVQCDCLTPDYYDQCWTKIQECLNRSMYGLMDIFFVPMLYLYSNAYATRRFINKRNAVKQLGEMIENLLNNKESVE